jgi:tetratricopeptide (TPR) repeat protein
MKTMGALILVISVVFFSFSVFSEGGVHPQPGNPAPGQSGTTGAIKGYVKDAKTSAAIDKVSVTLVYMKNESVKYNLQTDKNGYYYMGGLTPGYYKSSFEKDGFLPASQTWRVPLAETVRADVELQTLETARTVASPAMAQKAMTLFKDSKWEEAVKEFSEGISGDPANPLLYFYRGLSQENRGQMEEALADYQKAIELPPDFVLPYSRSAKIYARRQNHERANEFYRKAIELGDQDSTTLYNNAVVLMNLGKSAEAKVALESLLERDRDYADAYYHLGILSIGQGETEKAKEFLRKFLSLDPENPNAPLAKQILESLG